MVSANAVKQRHNGEQKIILGLSFDTSIKSVPTIWVAVRAYLTSCLITIIKILFFSSNRSMGILLPLPPVSQVTNSRINLTQHHRNRSLDSALQRIPEVSTLVKVHCAFRNKYLKTPSMCHHSMMSQQSKF